MTSPILRVSSRLPCSLRAPSGGEPLAEQGVAPGFCVHATQEFGSSRITARAVARRGCLRWLDVDRMKGGAGLPAWIGAK